MKVREAYEQEKSSLMQLPDNPFSAYEVVVVSVGKTPYVRFDRCLFGASADGTWLDGHSWACTAEGLLNTAREAGWHLHRTYTCNDCHLNGELN